MCGICGSIEINPDKEVGLRMIHTLQHRGPDAQGVKVYNNEHCMLCHARLSIIDLSEAANQPMEFDDLVVVFNGEIYNFKEIRTELESLGHGFRLQSDTEVILHAYKQWGERCVDHFIGMFAFAILDKSLHQLFLCRDRAGIKPLYYYKKGETFLFASELKAFYQHPDFIKKVDPLSRALYFQYGYVPAPYAIFKDVRKVEAGTWMKIDIDSQEITTIKYWDVNKFYAMPKLSLSYEEAMEQLEHLLESAFNYRMVADVPVGIFLSGGFDSVGLTSLLQKDRTVPQKTFTIGFNQGNNEAPIAKEVAKRLGTNHTEYICTEEDCQKILPDLPKFFDEPFSDNSAVPTILVSRIARRQVKVVLSADGGDETFGGYNSYAGLLKANGILNKFKAVRSDFFSKATLLMTGLLPQYTFLREKAETFAKLLALPVDYRVSAAFMYGGMLMESVYNMILREPYPSLIFGRRESDYHNPLDVALSTDYQNYMANDILVKVDRSTMSTSLEGRDPLLDHRIVEFAARLPMDYKIKNGVRKRIFRDIVYKYVPRELMDRPKTGFTMPIDAWLKGKLHYLLDEYLTKSELDDEVFNVKRIMHLRNLFESGKLKHENKVIWRLLVYQMWEQKNLKETLV
jgi:asparagine synthase (glutamine-hydrolysing)